MSKTLRTFFCVVLLLTTLTAFAQTSGVETFEGFRGPNQFTSARNVEAKPITVGGGQTITGTPIFAADTVYATAGTFMDTSSCVIHQICNGAANFIIISGDQPFESLSLDLIQANIQGFVNYTGSYVFTNTENRSQSFRILLSGPGARINNFSIPWKTNGIEILMENPITGNPANCPVFPQSELYMFGVDNLRWTVARPIRLLTGEGRPIDVGNTKIVDASSIDVTYPLGTPFFFKVQQLMADGKTWENVAAAYTIFEFFSIPQPQRLSYQLYPNNHLFFFGPNGPETGKMFQTVHSGDVTVQVLPQPISLRKFDIKLHIISADKLGDERGPFDGDFIRLGDESGIPPQFLKAQADVESNFDVKRWRYRAITVDHSEMHNGPTDVSRSPQRNYLIGDPPFRSEGSHLCPSPAITNGYLPHDCAFPISDIANRYTLGYSRDCVTSGLTAGADFINPVTIREIYNAGYGDGPDPAPQYGPTRQVCPPPGRVRAVNPGYVPDPLNVSAQTPMASSYGLMQVIPTAAIRNGNWRGVSSSRGTRYNPALLFDNTGIANAGSLIPGVNTDVQYYRSANGNVTSFANQDAYYRRALWNTFGAYRGDFVNYPARILQLGEEYLPETDKNVFDPRPEGTGCAPVITSQTPSLTAAPGTSLNLGVSVSGDVSSYQWYQGNGTPVPNGGYKYLSVTANASTSYYVEVRNDCGVTRSDSIAINVVPACPVVSIVSSPAGDTIDQGNPTTLQVAAGNAVSYQWYIGNGPLIEGTDGDRSRPIPNSNTAHLEVRPDTTTSYWVLAINGCGTALSGTATVTVRPCTRPSVAEPLAAPAFTSSGDTKPLTVAAAGTNLRYQWFRNGVDTGVDSATISVPSPSTPTTYSVRVWNACGEATSNTITVLPYCDPATISQPLVAPAFATASETKPLTVSASGTDLHYQWLRNGVAAGVDAPTIAVPAPSVPTTYAVRVHNACGEVTSNVVTVQPPAFCNAASIVQPLVAPAFTLPTETLPLTVFAGGSDLHYQWFRDGTDLNTDSATISVAAPASPVTYSVRVYNACSEATSNSVTVQPPAPCTPPSIVQPLAGETFASPTETKSITVSAAGSDLHYQWFRNGVDAGVDNATIPVPAPSVPTTYAVRIHNVCGELTSNVVTVMPPCTAPSVQPLVAPAFSTSGETKALTVSATGSDLHYQWLRNGVDLGVDDATISISAPSSPTTYAVRVYNNCGDVTSNVVTVQPPAPCQPPAITGQSPNPTIAETHSVSLTVAASGTTPLESQWQELIGSIWTNLDGEISTSLTVTPAAGEHSYRLVVSNDCGSTTSAPIVVTVVACGPAITRQPAAPSFTAIGQTATVSVDATGTNLRYQWYSSANGTTYSALTGEVFSELEVAASNTGKYYYVTLTSDCATINSNVIHVAAACAPPHITGTSGDVTIAPGGTATLSVSVDGTNPSFQWFGNDSVGGAFVRLDGQTSAFLDVSPGSTREYYVEVANACGSAQSQPMRVTIDEPPPVCVAAMITEQPRGATIAQGTIVTVSVAATGSDLRVQWYEYLPELDREFAVVNGADVWSITAQPHASGYYLFARVRNQCSDVRSENAVFTFQ